MSAEHRPSNRSCLEYQQEVMRLLRSGRRNPALGVIKDALVHFPKDPTLLSYQGYLVSLVEKNPRRGVEICLTAIEGAVPESSDSGITHAVFYLNLARAHLCGGNRRSALEAIRKGLTYDPESRDLMWELKRLGTRRKPPIPFLNRNNFLNRILGKLRHKITGGISH